MSKCKLWYGEDDCEEEVWKDDMCIGHYAEHLEAKVKQQAEQIGVLSASLELALNQQKIDRAENQRLKEELKHTQSYFLKGEYPYERIKELLAAQPQKESEE